MNSNEASPIIIYGTNVTLTSSSHGPCRLDQLATTFSLQSSFINEVSFPCLIAIPGREYKLDFNLNGDTTIELLSFQLIPTLAGRNE